MNETQTLVPGVNPVQGTSALDANGRPYADDAANVPAGASAELAAMDAHALKEHGVSLGTLLARLIHQSTGINLTPRVVRDTANADKTATVTQIGPSAPKVPA